MKQFLVFFLAATAWCAEVHPPGFRLPVGPRPLHYALDLTVVPELPTYSGTATIRVALPETVSIVWLNGLDLQVENATVDYAGTRAAVSSVKTAEEALGFEFTTSLGPGEITLRIPFRARLREDLNVGAFRIRDSADWYAYTTFTAIEARRAFPCFDEPQFKTPWQLTLHVKREQTALSNTRAVSETAEADGMKRVVFAETQPLPSYLAAFAAGPFEFVDAGLVGERRVPARVVVPRGRSASASAAAQMTAGIVAELERYTGIPYPFDKLDHLALLQSAYGGVENPGLITYKLEEFLIAADVDAPTRRQHARNLMMHEVAHQWFGNLVTMTSWKDVWLSEGLTTWLTWRLTDISGIERTRRRYKIMAADAPLSVRAVRKLMDSRSDMKDVYGVIVYDKAGALLTMIENWLGGDVFQRAVRSYLGKYRYGSATAADFLAELKQASGRGVSAVFRSFFDIGGAPVLHSELDCTTDNPKLTLEQRRYSETADTRWSIPVCVRWAGGTGDPQCVVMEGPRFVLPLEGAKGCPAWVQANAGGIGYYLSDLSPELLHGLLDSGWAQMSSAERLSLIMDIRDLHPGGVSALGSDLQRLYEQRAAEVTPKAQ
jgi:alanyl aminopeptidase